ncbi:MAG: phenylacetate--CoA ligase [Phycisphaerae bacterium]|nr:phenylacetate--CoA ligase [Phycisphaerae bacterium]
MSDNATFHNKAMETASPDELRSIQDQRLREIVRHVYDSNPAHRQRFDAVHAKPEEIEGLDDLRTLPLMDKEVFRKGYPLVLSCVDKRQIVEMHMSSGSTGTPVVMPYTQDDLDQWAECMARCYVMAGARAGDPVQITPSFGLFNGGFGMYHGARAAGLFVIPTGAGNTARQIRLARDFGTRVITGVVSYGVRIMEVLGEDGGQLPDLEIGIFGAEVFSEPMKKKIEAGLGIEAFDIYGMTETGGVGTLGMDCPAHEGIHVWEDHYVIEIIDPETDAPVEEGCQGELVVTSLTRQALPVIRFRTGDLTRIVSTQRCACGRTHARIAPITGRGDDMLIIKGVNFFPKQVEQVLMQIPGVGANYQLIIEDVDGVKDLRVNVEAESNVTGFMVEKALKEALGFSPKGDVFPIGELPRQPGKAQRVFYENKNGQA